MTWRRHGVSNAPLVDHAVELRRSELRALIGDDFGWNAVSGKMNLKLDDDVLGCRAGQVVDLYERIEVVNCRKVLPSIQFKEISPNFHPWALATAVLSQRFFWLWGFICWHASQCSASALCLNLGHTCPYNSSRARLNMLSWPRWAECSLFSISLLRVK